MSHIIKDDKELVEKAENITCVSDYLDVLKYINKKREEKNTVLSTMFFRGSSDESRPDEPSIYRKINGTDTTLVECEKNLYYDIISRCPDDFRHCDTALDHLVMMQHYGLPTRLLDITENPLVALYFACKNHEKETKAVVSIYEVGNIDIKNYNSDTAAMIANLAKMDIDFSSLRMKCKQIIKKIEKDKGQSYDKCKKDLLSLFEEVLAKKQLNKANWINEFCKTSLYELFNEEKRFPVQFFNMKSEMDIKIDKAMLDDSYNDEKKEDDALFKDSDEIRLLHFIQSEKPYFDGDRIEVKDLEDVIFIKTKQNNPNIIKQNGAFILFGVKTNSFTKKVCASIPENYYFLTEQDQKIKCIIDKQYKHDIVMELDALSISESQLFPEISKVAGYFSDKYSKMIKSDFIKTTSH